jgi:hypothetical protein
MCARKLAFVRALFLTGALILLRKKSIRKNIFLANKLVFSYIIIFLNNSKITIRRSEGGWWVKRGGTY